MQNANHSPLQCFSVCLEPCFTICDGMAVQIKDMTEESHIRVDFDMPIEFMFLGWRLTSNIKSVKINLAKSSTLQMGFVHLLLKEQQVLSFTVAIGTLIRIQTIRIRIRKSSTVTATRTVIFLCTTLLSFPRICGLLQAPSRFCFQSAYLFLHLGA